MNRILFSSILVLCLSITAWSQEPSNPRNLLPGDGIISVKTLQQNWSDNESRKFYHAPQGSQLIPYRWFLFLDQADNDKPFLDPGHIRALGYLPRSPDNFGNPDGLPIGFVRDMPFPDGSAALGMSCAACHTTQINHKNIAWLIDGAPTLGDIETFQRSLQAALKATIDDDNKFERFANNVLRQTSPYYKDELKLRMQHFEAQRRQYNERNMPAPGAPHFGHGRVDAFGAIMNEVTANFLHLQENVKPANAPVSYPFLWDTPQHDFVQWNGIAENTTSILGSIFVGTRHIGALGRNTGEVLGVFGNVNLDHKNFGGSYTSSVDRRSLIDIEDSLRTLWSPVWPTEMGEIDNNMRIEGMNLFNIHCAKCHTNNEESYEFDRTDPNRFIKAKMKAVGTDDTMYLNFALRRAKTGILKGRHRTLNIFSRPLESEEQASVLLTHVIQRVIVGPNFERAAASPAHLAALEVQMPLNLSFRTSEGVLTGNFKTIVPHGGRNTFLVSGENIRFTPNAMTAPNAGILMLSAENDGTALFHGTTESYNADSFNTLSAIRPITTAILGTGSTYLQLRVTAESINVTYKARPLNGIWATAPYLHNGSVPNLWELLKPVNHPDANSRRTKTFFVGNRVFDTKNVGFQSDDGPFKFDTTLPGNSNAGHEYGTTLLELEKRQLIEYLKSL